MRAYTTMGVQDASRLAERDPCVRRLVPRVFAPGHAELLTHRIPVRLVSEGVCLDGVTLHAGRVS